MCVYVVRFILGFFPNGIYWFTNKLSCLVRSGYCENNFWVMKKRFSVKIPAKLFNVAFYRIKLDNAGNKVAVFQFTFRILLR